MNLPAMPPSLLSSPADPVQRRVLLLRRMAWICAVLVLAITSLSAYIRLSKAGLGCEPWPQCYGQQLRAQQQGEPPLQADAATAGARLAHRVIASSALLLVLVMVMAAVASRRRPRVRCMSARAIAQPATSERCPAASSRPSASA